MSLVSTQATEKSLASFPSKTDLQPVGGDHEVIARIDETLDLIAKASDVLAGFRPVDQFDVSIIIPAYNQIDTLPDVLKRIWEVMPVTTETIVVDDGSTDGTSMWLSLLPDRERLRVLHRRHHHGKGSAIRVGMRHCRGRVIAIQSGDLQYDPANLLRVIWPVLDGNADAVFGSRYLEPDNSNIWWQRFGSRLLNTVGNRFTGTRLSDIQCCQKAFDRDLISSIVLRERGWEFDWEITAKIARRDARMIEVPVSCDQPSPASESAPSWRQWITGLAGLWKRNSGRG